MIALLATTGLFGLALVLPPLGGVYIGCLIVGGGLLVISTLFGGDHDADFDGGDVDLGGDVDVGDVDVDAASGVDLDTDAGDIDVGDVQAGDLDHAAAAHDLVHAHEASSPLALSDWFSMRFVVYFAATFGFVGTVLTYVTDMSSGWTLAVALVGGIAIGQGVHQLIRALGRSGANSAVRTHDFVNQPARVTVAVRPPARGEVGVHIGNREMFVPAVAKRSDDSFDIGAQVVITAYTGGMAQVVSREEYEFVNPS